VQNYEIPWRPIYEKGAALAWIIGAAAMFIIAQRTGLPEGPFIIMGGASIVMAAWRAQDAAKKTLSKRALGNKKVDFIKWPEFQKKVKNESLWLGRGFDWGQTEIERASFILKRDPKNIFGRGAKKIGNHWIHGLGEKETDLRIELKALEGQTLIVGTTGAGKTSLFVLILAQAILRGEPVVIIDPKGDHGLRKIAQKVCEMLGTPEKFVFFHPAHPEKSARIDPLRNWNRSTELASRLAALIPSETKADPFTAFGWMALNNTINGLLAVEERPNLVKLRRFVEGDPGPLVIRALRMYYDKHVQDWEMRIKSYQRGKRSQEDEVSAYIKFYQQEVVNEKPSPEMEGLISSYTHNREHFQKMIASLIPILNMLTGGALGSLLSPEPDPDDPRLITDTSRIINKGQVVYCALDSLSDSTVGSAIGAILLADLVAVAGDRYNYGEENSRVNILIDEAAEIVNDPLIQILNKGRGAGFNVFMATQTLADFEARTGSSAKGLQICGNLNNTVILRVIDGETQKYLSESLPTTVVRSLEQQYRSGASAAVPGDFSGMYAETLKEEESELIPSHLLGMLPNLHYMAKLADGRIVKGRLPILLTD